MSDEPIVITNPDDPTQTYTVGRRGRKPLWVIPILETMDLPQKESIKVKKEKEKKSWTLNGKCIIVADDEVEAIMMFNKTVLRFPITANELHSMWKTIPDNGTLDKGVWEMIDNEWVRREQLQELGV